MQQSVQPTSYSSPAAALVPHQADLDQAPQWTLIAVRRGMVESALADHQVITSYFAELQDTRFKDLAAADQVTLREQLVPETVPADQIVALIRTLRGMRHLSDNQQLPDDMSAIASGWARKYGDNFRVHPLMLTEPIAGSDLVNTDLWNATLKSFDYLNPERWDVFYVSAQSLLLSDSSFHPEAAPEHALATLVMPRILPPTEEIQRASSDIKRTQVTVALSNLVGTTALTAACFAPFVELPLSIFPVGDIASTAVRGAVGLLSAVTAAGALWYSLHLKRASRDLGAKNWLREEKGI